MPTDDELYITIRVPRSNEMLRRSKGDPVMFYDVKVSREADSNFEFTAIFIHPLMGEVCKGKGQNMLGAVENLERTLRMSGDGTEQFIWGKVIGRHFFMRPGPTEFPKPADPDDEVTDAFLPDREESDEQQDE